MNIIIIITNIIYLMASYSPFNIHVRGYLLSIISPNLHPPQTELARNILNVFNAFLVRIYLSKLQQYI